MKPICIILARSGSKGLPDKNMLFLSGKPMIFHTIESALNSGYFKKSDIYVSTDSLVYKEIIEKLGVKVVLRDSSLAADNSTTFDVLKDFLKDFNDNQVFMLCQATSPLRSAADIKNAMELYEKNKGNIVSFTKADKSPTLYTHLSNDNSIKDIIGIDKGYRRQNERPLYYPNGAIFLSMKAEYMGNASFFTESTKAYIMSKVNSIDVDDKVDFINAIGAIYFNYEKREIQNKRLYTEKYQELLANNEHSSMIVGDSRMEEIKIPGFFNASIGGVSMHTFYKNIDLFLQGNVKKIFLALGINDLITGYSLKKLETTFKLLMQKLNSKNIEVIVSKVTYTIFREGIDNSKIQTFNNFLEKFCENTPIKLLDFNPILSKGEQLTYDYTTDGLHLNSHANLLIENFLSKYI